VRAPTSNGRHIRHRHIGESNDCSLGNGGTSGRREEKYRENDLNQGVTGRRGPYGKGFKRWELNSLKENWGTKAEKKVSTGEGERLR